MPIREFCCRECGEIFEALVFGPQDEALEACPVCGSAELERLFSVFGLSGTTSKVATAGSCAGCTTRNCASCG